MRSQLRLQERNGVDSAGDGPDGRPPQNDGDHFDARYPANLPVGNDWVKFLAYSFTDLGPENGGVRRGFWVELTVGDTLVRFEQVASSGELWSGNHGIIFFVDPQTISFTDAGGRVAFFDMEYPPGMVEGDVFPAGFVLPEQTPEPPPPPPAQFDVDYVIDGENPLSVTFTITTVEGVPPFGFWTADRDYFEQDDVPNPFTYVYSQGGTFATGFWDDSGLWNDFEVTVVATEGRDAPTPGPQLTFPWDALTTHAEIGAWADAQGVDCGGSGWDRMTLAGKREWLTNHFGGARPWETETSERRSP